MDSNICGSCGSSLIGDFETVSYTPLQVAHLESYFTLEEGAAFTARYTIQGEIGRGGMGIVYKAHDHVLNTTVALKIIHPMISSHADVVKRFKQETLLARSVSHENVVRIHDIGEIEGLFYLSMDYIEGQNLKKQLLSHMISTLEEKIDIAKQICRALVAAHQKGIIHRDLKPQNIMVDVEGRLFVSDFGLAKSLEAHDMVFSEGIVGTPPYMSPEQCKGEESNQRSDIYSLGIIFYEMFSGYRPFKSDTRAGYLRQHIHELPKPPVEINPEIPDYIQTIILKCLEKEPENRYAQVYEILAELEPRKDVVPAVEPPKSKRLFLGIATVLVLIVVAVFTYNWLSERPGEAMVLPESARISVAVMRFENNTGNQDYDYLRRVLQNYLYQDLSQSKYLHMFPDDKLLQVLMELGAADVSEFSAGVLNPLATDYDIQYFILGSIAGAGNDIWISATIRKAQTHEILATVRASGEKVDDIDSMVDGLTRQIKKAFDLTAAQIAADIDGNIGDISTPSEKALDLYMSGRRLRQERKFQKSIEMLEQAVKIDPEFALAYIELYDDYYNLQDQEKSRECLLKAQSYSHRASEKGRLIINGLSAVEFESSVPKAIEIYKQLIDLDPQDPVGHGYLAWMYRKAEEWEKAANHYRIQTNSKDTVDRAQALDNLAWVNMVLGDYDEALEIMRDNQDAFSNQAWFHRFVGNLYLCTGEYEAALKEATKTLELEPDYLENHLLKGNIHLLREEFPEAEHAYQKMIDSDTEWFKARGKEWQAKLHLTLGEYKLCHDLAHEALVIARKADLEDHESDLLYLLCHIESQCGNSIALERYSGELIELALEMDHPPYHIRALRWRGEARLMSGRTDESKDIADEIEAQINKTGLKKMLRYHKHLLGTIALAEDDLDGALKMFEGAYALILQQNYIVDNHALFLDPIAAVYVRKKDYDKAWDVNKKISQLTSGRLGWGDVWGLSYYEMGKIAQLQERNADAVALYKRFLSLWSKADSDLDAVKDARKQLRKLESEGLL
jgi:serine/threonine protein kinase/Tfp pilus assembly protein PilF